MRNSQWAFDIDRWKETDNNGCLPKYSHAFYASGNLKQTLRITCKRQMVKLRKEEAYYRDTLRCQRLAWCVLYVKKCCVCICHSRFHDSGNYYFFFFLCNHRERVKLGEAAIKVLITARFMPIIIFDCRKRKQLTVFHYVSHNLITPLHNSHFHLEPWIKIQVFSFSLFD